MQRFAKPPSGVTCFEGSNPSLSASSSPHRAPVAQWIERQVADLKVVGSSPAGRAILPSDAAPCVRCRHELSDHWRPAPALPGRPHQVSPDAAFRRVSPHGVRSSLRMTHLPADRSHGWWYVMARRPRRPSFCHLPPGGSIIWGRIRPSGAMECGRVGISPTSGTIGGTVGNGQATSRTMGGNSGTGQSTGGRDANHGRLDPLGWTPSSRAMWRTR